MPDAAVRPAFGRVWAMPSRHTFTIRPIAELLGRWMPRVTTWVDPFAGFHSPAQCTNDLNPEAPTDQHEDGETFVRRFERIDGLLFDPPYSPRQLAECYHSIGRDVGTKESQNAALYRSVKDAAVERMPIGALAICCGWSSAGMGAGRGFELLEVLLVSHGGAHNDTIVTVERRTTIPPRQGILL